MVAPVPHEVAQDGRHDVGAHQPQPPQRQRGVLQKVAVGKLSGVEDGHKAVNDLLRPRQHLPLDPHRNLPDGPGGVVANADRGGAEVLDEYGQQRGDMAAEVPHAGFRQVPHQRDAGLPHIRGLVLEALQDQLTQVGVRHKTLQRTSHPVGQPAEHVQGAHHKLAVRRLHAGVVLGGQLVLEVTLDEVATAAEDGLGEGLEARSHGLRHGGQAGQQWEQCAVVILDLGPLQQQRGHQHLDQLWRVQPAVHCIREGHHGVVQDEEVLLLVLREARRQAFDDGLQVGNQIRLRLLLQGGEGGARRLLHPLVVVQQPQQKNFQQGLEERFVVMDALADDPPRVPAECPTSNGPHQGLRLGGKSADEVGDQHLQVGPHPRKAPLGDSPQRQDRALPHLPGL
eukprot:RCo050888